MIPTVGVLVHKLIFCRYVFFVNTKTAKYCVGKQIYVHVHVGLTRFYCLCLLLTEPRPSAVRQRDVRRRSVLHKPRAQRIQRQVSQLTHIVVDVLGVAFSLENTIITFIVTVSANRLWTSSHTLYVVSCIESTLIIFAYTIFAITNRNWFVVLGIIVTCCLFTHTQRQDARWLGEDVARDDEPATSVRQAASHHRRVVEPTSTYSQPRTSEKSPSKYIVMFIYFSVGWCGESTRWVTSAPFCFWRLRYYDWICPVGHSH